QWTVGGPPQSLTIPSGETRRALDRSLPYRRHYLERERRALGEHVRRRDHAGVLLDHRRRCGGRDLLQVALGRCPHSGGPLDDPANAWRGDGLLLPEALTNSNEEEQSATSSNGPPVAPLAQGAPAGPP